MNSLFLHHSNKIFTTSNGIDTTQLLDGVTKSFLGINEWVAQELERLTYRLPRNCYNHESLVTVIESIAMIEPYYYILPSPRQTTTTKRYQYSQKNLIFSFILLISYCDQERLQFYDQYHRTLLELVIELEKMCELFDHHEMDTERFLQSAIHTHKSLSRVLFGEQVPISNTLLEAWLIMSTWAQQGKLLFQTSIIHAEQWVKLGTSSYQIAKRICGL